ncbi:MAG TPA: nuclear transport factor 2 family protein [Bryobacteraceae bacterium]|jgi:SnoaL-like domain|nr:nuclear transport factor 2 family protein [Bryobacteraceae bacterium]
MVVEQTTTRQLIDIYLKAFERQELEQCMDCFHSDATLEWLMGEYRGQSSIEEWHKDRFAAGLKILRVDGVSIQGEIATVRITVTSKRLAAWRMPSLAGIVTVTFQGGKIHGTKFAAKSINPQQNWS